MPLQSWLEGLVVESDGTTQPFDMLPKDFHLHPLTTLDKDFPHCCEDHLKSFQDIKEWANAFLPEEEAMMLSKKTLYNLSNTESFILFTFNQDDWYEEISEYIEYTIWSFGSSINHAERYLLKLLGFINSIQIPNNYHKSRKLCDLTLLWLQNSMFSRELFYLRRAFDRWFYFFPFELSFLHGLKDKYDLFFGIVNNNFIDFDEESFMVELNKISDAILSNYNTINLYNQGSLVDPPKVRNELILSKRKLEIDIGFFEPDGSPVKQDYREKILEWLSAEIKFITEISSFLEPTIKEDHTASLNHDVLAIIKNLEPFKFKEHIIMKGLKEEHVLSLMNEHSGKELMPYSIALLNEIGFLNKFFEKFKRKGDGYKKLSEIFKVDPRRIRGNVTILHPKSMEDSTQYGSITYMASIKESLLGLI